MNSLIKWLLDVIILLYLFAGLAFWFWKNKRFKYLFLILASIWLFIIYISPVPIIITEKWERTYPAFKFNDHKDLLNDSLIFIIVLGAGYENDPELSSTSKLGNTVALRLLEGIRIYRRYPNAKLVSSGANINQKISQAYAVSIAAVELGVSPDDTLLLSNTINTKDEVFNFVKRFGRENKVIIVTDAVHMRRAIYWSEYYGLNPIPAPCNYLVKIDPDFPDNRWEPGYNKIKMLNSVLREWTGLLVAKWSN